MCPASNMSLRSKLCTTCALPTNWLDASGWEPRAEAAPPRRRQELTPSMGLHGLPRQQLRRRALLDAARPQAAVPAGADDAGVITTGQRRHRLASVPCRAQGSKGRGCWEGQQASVQSGGLMAALAATARRSRAWEQARGKHGAADLSGGSLCRPSARPSAPGPICRARRRRLRSCRRAGLSPRAAARGAASCSAAAGRRGGRRARHSGHV